MNRKQILKITCCWDRLQWWWWWWWWWHFNIYIYTRMGWLKFKFTMPLLHIMQYN